MTDSSQELLEEAAAKFGIEPTSALREQATSESLSTTLTATQPEASPARNLRLADDQYNAFLYSFDLNESSGVLTDLTVAVKDNIFVAGVPITCGSDAFELTPSYHARVVDRLLNAGSTITGTTNMDEFAYYTTGETCAHGHIENPVVDGHVPGGSSSGSGAAVAADLVDVALGSDTGGSIRIPASFCGIVGFKPTYGTVPRSGIVDLSPSLDHIGPLAQNVTDAARVYDAISGQDFGDPSTWFSIEVNSVADNSADELDQLSIGTIDEALQRTDAEIVSRIREVESELEGRGHSVSTVSVPEYSEVTTANAVITGLEFTSLFENNGLVYGSGSGVSEALRQAVIKAKESGSFGKIVQQRLLTNYIVKYQTAGKAYLAAQQIRRQFVQHLAELFEEYDILLTPTTPMTAPKFGAISADTDLVRTLVHTAPFNVSGNPALSVPDELRTGDPIGIQVVGNWFDDSLVCQLGKVIEQL